MIELQTSILGALGTGEKTFKELSDTINHDSQKELIEALNALSLKGKIMQRKKPVFNDLHVTKFERYYSLKAN